MLPCPRRAVLTGPYVTAAFAKNIIARRRAGEADHNDGLSRLARANDDGSVLTDDELVGHTVFLFMAGHATTASALTWTLLLLLPEGGGWLHMRVVSSDADCGCSIRNATPPWPCLLGSESLHEVTLLVVRHMHTPPETVRLTGATTGLRTPAQLSTSRP